MTDRGFRRNKFRNISQKLVLSVRVEKKGVKSNCFESDLDLLYSVFL